MRIGATGRRHERKPTLEEIEQARVSLHTFIAALNWFIITQFY